MGLSEPFASSLSGGGGHSWIALLRNFSDKLRFGVADNQVREMLLKTPALVGVEASDASDVVAYLGDELGLNGKGQLAEALARCPPMLMYNVQDNLRKKARRFPRRTTFAAFV